MQSRISNIPRRPAGFTLVEVLISIAIALVLIIGISQIFAMAQQTSGAGTTLLKGMEYQRTVQQTFAQDLSQIVLGDDSAGMVIGSYSIAAFRNQQDMQTDRDGDPLTFNDPSNPTNPGATTDTASQAFQVNDRIHRVDRLCFFARGQFHRQTAEAPNFVSPTTSSEAFIWYGHLAQPNNPEISGWDPNDPAGVNAKAPAAWYGPGAPGNAGQTPPSNNDNNLFASSWILGRQVILLNPSGTEPGFTRNDFSYQPLSTAASTSSPPNNAAPEVGSSGVIPVFSSRCDLSYTPISACRTVYATARYNQTWWEDLSGLAIPQAGLPPFPIPATNFLLNVGNFSYVSNDVRYMANPFPTRPATYSNSASGSGATPAQVWQSAAAAQTAPIFVRGCSQFIVEYAGNFLTQDQGNPLTDAQYGRILAAAPDPTGKLDFIAVRDQNGNVTRQIRWYGFPRDVNGDGVVDLNVPPTGGALPYSKQPTGGFDVVPLVSVIRAALGASAPAEPFEKVLPATISTDGFSSMQMTPKVVPAFPAKSGAYVCAWDPTVPTSVEPRPKLIRIIVGLDDPAGRLNSEQTFEYVFALP